LSDVSQSTILYSVRELGLGGLRLRACVEKSSLADFGRFCAKRTYPTDVWNPARVFRTVRRKAYELNLLRQ